MKKRFFCVKINQRDNSDAPNLVIFFASAKEVNQWAGIRRVGEVPKGTQRLLKTTRVNAIKRFFMSNPINSIPVSVILAFNTGMITFENLNDVLVKALPGVDISNGIGKKGEWGLISFDFDEKSPEEERPAIIVDGQHRIKGMSSVEEELPIAIAAYINVDSQEQAFQFVVINNKAQKVPTDNVKAIIKCINEEELQKRLLKAGVSYGNFPATLGDIDGLPDSPFFQLLEWPLNPTENKKIQLTTIESNLKYIKSILSILSDDEDTLKVLFMSIWRGVRNCYPTLWLHNDKFMTKVNIVALNEFIVDKLENAWLDGNLDIYESVQVESYSKKFLEEIPAEFWETEWMHPVQDNAVVRGKIKDDLRKITQNKRAGREWKDGLKLIAET